MSAARQTGLKGFVFDVDGVLWRMGAPEVGMVSFLEELRNEDMPFCLLTNDCSVSTAQRHRALVQAGFVLKVEQVITAGSVTGHWLREAAVETIMYLGAPGALADIAENLQVRDAGPVDVVVVGDWFGDYDRKILDEAVKALDAGASLVAMQHNRRWSDGLRSYVDNGFWVAGLEYVSNRLARVVGKPSEYAYGVALANVGGAAASSIAYISDDIEVDLKGAKDAGLTTVYYGLSPKVYRWVDHTAFDPPSLRALQRRYSK